MADLQQALAELKDIHLPEPVSIWQVAPGWWLSALLSLLVFIIGYRLIVKYIRVNRYRRHALRQLNDLCAQQDKLLDDFQLLSEINQLLKSVAIRAYPDHACSALSGKQWQQFLAQTIAHQKQAAPEVFNVFELLYQANPTIDEQQRELLISNARIWLKKHTPLSLRFSEADQTKLKESYDV